MVGDFALSILSAVMFLSAPAFDPPRMQDIALTPSTTEWQIGVGTRGATVTISDDNEPKWIKYGLVGAVIGLAVGGFTGYAIHSTECTDGLGCDTDRNTMEGALIGLAVGGSLGALVGLREAHRE